MLFSQPASWKVSYSTPIIVHTAVTVILEYFIKWTSQVDELINYNHRSLTIHGIGNCDVTKTLLTYSIFLSLV